MHPSRKAEYVQLVVVIFRYMKKMQAALSSNKITRPIYRSALYPVLTYAVALLPSMRAKNYESIYTQNKDPWNLDSDALSGWYFRQIVSILPKGKLFDKALDVGCAKGNMTAKLLSISKHAMGMDISKTAVGIARQRHKSERLEFIDSDIAKDGIKGKYSLIICRDVLYYVPKPLLRKTVLRLEGALASGGYIVLAEFANNEGTRGQDKLLGEVCEKLCEKQARFKDERVFVISLYKKRINQAAITS